MGQKFKTVYFKDYNKINPNSKGVTIAFSENDLHIYNKVKHLSSHQIRKLLGVDSFLKLKQMAQDEGLSVGTFCTWHLKRKTKEIAIKSRKRPGDYIIDPIHVTFRGNKNYPLQSWFSYLEGYSPDFVKCIVNKYIDPKASLIYDPFSGTGTTPITTSELGFESIYSEINPLMQYLTRIKIKARNSKRKTKLIEKLTELQKTLKKSIERNSKDNNLENNYYKTFGDSKFFENDIFEIILKTSTFINNTYFDDILISELLKIATASILVKCSKLKRHGDLRFKNKKELQSEEKIDFYDELILAIENIKNDLGKISETTAPILITEDARNIEKIDFLGIDAVITSPPYLNGTNYFRNTKIELWFLGYLQKNQDLNKFRRLAVTAGINDVSFKEKKILQNKTVNSLVNKLEKVAYDKRIPKMVFDYFADMDKIFRGISKHLNQNAKLAIDLGDSIYSGVHVPTDKILISLLENQGYQLENNIILRKRISNNGQELKQVLLIFKFNRDNKTTISVKKYRWEKEWSNFKKYLPHTNTPLSKRNWGDQLHSLCSYQGKLKPSLANQLVSIFVPERGSILDIFSGVGTIPLEAGLQGKKSYGFDINPAAVTISKAKLNKLSRTKIKKQICDLKKFINNNTLTNNDIEEAGKFGFNKKMKDYFHEETLKEIINARIFFNINKDETAESAFVMSCILHILHGNRPYALSRRSHGITPFAPTGDFIYKNLIEKLQEKVDRSLNGLNRNNFLEGKIYFQDTTKTWPKEINNIDAIITSPPFFDSTKFYLANWMRIWFSGWDDNNFKIEPVNFIDELQKKDFSIYESIFRQAREKLKKDGVFVLHLGKSHKCNMAEELSRIAKNWFNIYDIFEESVEKGESHGIKDKGSTVKHQYLVLT